MLLPPQSLPQYSAETLRKAVAAERRAETLREQLDEHNAELASSREELEALRRTTEAQATEDPAVASLREELRSRNARVAELEHNLAARDMEISRLETGAVTAWDTTVPNLEHRIDELADHNTQLQRELAAMSDRLDGQLGEAEALRRALQERDRRLAENEGRAS